MAEEVSKKITAESKKDNIFAEQISLSAFATISGAPRQLWCIEDQGKN
jgi:hypothetical protein